MSRQVSHVTARRGGILLSPGVVESRMLPLLLDGILPVFPELLTRWVISASQKEARAFALPPVGKATMVAPKNLPDG
jgi:hypothetical protein